MTEKNSTPLSAYEESVWPRGSKAAPWKFNAVESVDGQDHQDREDEEDGGPTEGNEGNGFGTGFCIEDGKDSDKRVQSIALGPDWWLAGWRAGGTTAVRSWSSSPEGILAYELQGIDKTVESLRESVRSLEFQIKQHHLRCNSLLPLFSLLPEILEYIFLLVVPFPGQRQELSCLGLVCSWWQDVIFRSGKLWSNVLDVNDNQFWVRKVLE
ncbi:hypothetical protein BDR06DRAFT_975905 [Suillus hirtellus]|nr:hypothetical protein BDR06DRAFT_975905 [Suillus hirtellus]